MSQIYLPIHYLPRARGYTFFGEKTYSALIAKIRGSKLIQDLVNYIIGELGWGPYVGC